MNKIIEKGAKAAYEKYNEGLIGCCEPSWDELPEDFKDRLRETTKAFIAAIREPTNEMVEAAFGKSDLEPHPFRTVWYDMIDVILKE